MEKYLYIKSKELRKRLIEQDKIQKKKMDEWWNKILPRKGSVLRQLVNVELTNNKSL